jgi:hypothetical protein
MHIFEKVLAEMVDYGELLDTNDVVELSSLVDAVIDHNPDLNKRMEEQSALQLKAAYYYNRMQYLYEDAKRKFGDIYYIKYMELRDSKDSGRFSEKLVEATCSKVEGYCHLEARVLRFAYFAHQLSSLKEALVTRAKMLESVSNNVRMETRLSLSDDR